MHNTVSTKFHFLLFNQCHHFTIEKDAYACKVLSFTCLPTGQVTASMNKADTLTGGFLKSPCSIVGINKMAPLDEPQYGKGLKQVP